MRAITGSLLLSLQTSPHRSYVFASFHCTTWLTRCDSLWGSSPCEAPVKCFGLVLLFDHKYFLGDAHPTTNSKIISFLNKMSCLHSSNKRPNHARYRHTTYEASVITNFDGSSPLLIKGLVTSEHKYHCMMLAQKCSLNDMVLPDPSRQTNLTTSSYAFNKISYIFQKLEIIDRPS